MSSVTASVELERSRFTITGDSFNISFTVHRCLFPRSSPVRLATAAGSLTIDTNSTTGDAWRFMGALLLQPTVTFLPHGITLGSGSVIYVEINTSAETQNVTLQTGASTTNLSLQPESFMLFINGSIDVSVAGGQVFELAGTLAVNVTTSQVTIFVDASLYLGGDATSSVLTFNAVGLIDLQTSGPDAGFAAMLTLTLGGNSPSGITFGMNFLLVMNTTGSVVDYTIPSPPPTNPPSAPVPTVMGPDYSSSNPLALTSYETIVNGMRTLVIPAGAPPVGQSDYTAWVTGQAATPASDYIVILGRGSITILSEFTLTGSLNIMLPPSLAPA